MGEDEKKDAVQPDAAEKKLGLKMEQKSGKFVVSKEGVPLVTLNILELVKFGVAKSPNKIDDVVLGAIAPALNSFSYEKDI